MCCVEGGKHCLLQTGFTVTNGSVGVPANVSLSGGRKLGENKRRAELKRKHAVGWHAMKQ